MIALGALTIVSCSKSDEAYDAVPTSPVPVSSQPINTVVSVKSEEAAVAGIMLNAFVPARQAWVFKAIFKSTFSIKKYGDVIFYYTENCVAKNVRVVGAFRENWIYQQFLTPNGTNTILYNYETTNLNATIVITSAVYIEV